MISGRFLTRSAPKVLSRFTTSAIRRPTPFSAPLFKTSSAPSRLSLSSSFSTSSKLWTRAGESDEELIQKITSEIQMEKEMKGDDSTPLSVKDFLENGPFEVIDTPGSEEVLLKRKFGDENIRVSFSISDLNAMDNDPDYADRAMEDEDDMHGNPSDKAFKQAAEDAAGSSQSEDPNAENGEEQQQSFPSQLNITIEKPGKGTVLVEATAQDGMIIIDNVGFYKTLELALGKTADKAFERDNMYVGPPFGNLDEDLQVMIERYLDERGINPLLAVFVPDYMDMKEQKEYESWLHNVKGFLEA